MSAEEIKKQINEVDTNKINGLEKYEIEDFLSAPEKVQLLGNEMQEDFDVNNETLKEFKENIGNICKGILENETITNNQGRILLFYLKYFHNDEDPIGIEIIRNIVYGEEGKINEYITDSEDNRIKDINKRFNNLPGVKKIKQEKCMKLLELPDLTQKDIKWLEKYKKDYKLGEGMDKEIEEKIELAIANIEISEKVLSNISQNPLENLERICPGISKIKPNWQLIRQNIKTKDTENIKTEEDIHKLMEKINETITRDNIGEYLNLPEGTSEQDKPYIANNFIIIITQHLILHPGYKIGYGNEPEKLATGITLKDIVYDNELIILAMKKLKELNNRTKGSFDKLSKEDKEKEIKTIINENNHILFDLRLKNVINPLNEESIGDIVEEIVKYSITNYPTILDSFSKNNKYINNIVQAYKETELEKTREKEVNKILKEVDQIKIPDSLKGKFFDKEGNEIKTFCVFEKGSLFRHKDYYKKIKSERSKSEVYNKFCNLYESSIDFNKLKDTGTRKYHLPELTKAKDYIEFLGAFEKMNDDINRIEKETNDLRSGGFIPGYTGSVDAGISTYGMKKIKACNIEAARKYVEIWKKTDKSRRERPNSFLGIKLDRKYSNGDKNNNSDIDKIIRDTPIEGIKDSLDKIGDRTTQDIVGEIGGLIIGLISSSATLIGTGSNALAGAAYNIGNKAGNGLTQVAYDLLYDGLYDDVICKKALGIKKDSASNYDGINTSFGLGMGLYERDNNGNIIQKKTEGERFIDLIFSTLASTVSYYGAPIVANPLKFATFEQFLSEPLFNTLGAGTKAVIGTENYNGKTINQAFHEQINKEYSMESLQNKLVNVIATTLLANLFNATKTEKETPLIYDGEDIKADIFKANKSEVKKIIKNILSRSLSQLNKGTNQRNQIIVPTLLCTTFKINSPYLAPDEVIDKKIDTAREGIKTAKNQQEQELYLNTYIDYVTLEECLLSTETKEKRLLALAEETGITIDKTKVEEAEKRISRQYEKILKESEMVNNMVVEIAQKVESSIEESLT